MTLNAVWRLWVGARMGYINMDGATSRTDRILQTIYDGTPQAINDVTLSAMRSNGALLGIGVEFQRLEFSSEISADNVFNPTGFKEAEAAVPRVEEALRSLGMEAQVLVMHHLDISLTG